MNEDHPFCEFFDSSIGEWDFQKLAEVLPAVEVRLVQNIPVGRANYGDKAFWPYSKGGSYTIKSAYHSHERANREETYSSKFKQPYWIVEISVEIKYDP